MKGVEGLKEFNDMELVLFGGFGLLLFFGGGFFFCFFLCFRLFFAIPPPSSPDLRWLGPSSGGGPASRPALRANQFRGRQSDWGAAASKGGRRGRCEAPVGRPGPGTSGLTYRFGEAFPALPHLNSFQDSDGGGFVFCGVSLCRPHQRFVVPIMWDGKGQ